jgi:hypothetical protein
MPVAVTPSNAPPTLICDEPFNPQPSAAGSPPFYRIDDLSRRVIVLDVVHRRGAYRP